jgi:hypothetical protein
MFPPLFPNTTGRHPFLVVQKDESLPPEDGGRVLESRDCQAEDAQVLRPSFRISQWAIFPRVVVARQRIDTFLDLVLISI